MAVLFADIPCIDPQALAQACADRGLPLDWKEPEEKAPNYFLTENGRGPGTGRILLRKMDIDALDLTTDSDLTFLDDQGGKLVFKKITFLRAACITPGAEDDPAAAFLCDVADRRIHLDKIPINRGYNIASADGQDYLSGSTDGGTDWTWTTLIQDLFTTLDLGDATLPFEPDGTPENIAFFSDCSAWEALNRILDRIACTILYDGEADEFTIIRLGDTAAAGAVASAKTMRKLERDELRTWDRYWVETARGRLTEKVRVVFPRRPVPTGGSSPWYEVDITLTATSGVVSRTAEVLHDDLTAIGSGTPTNAAALATRAQERADDWLRKRLYAEARQTIVYRDFQSTSKLLSETVGAVAIDDRGGAMRTEVGSKPDDLLSRWMPANVVSPPQATWGVDYYTRHAGEWLPNTEFLIQGGVFEYEYITTLARSELIIPANTGWVWISAAISTVHGPVSHLYTHDLAAAAIAYVADIDEDYLAESQFRWGEKTFAHGQIFYVTSGLGTGLSTKRVVTGAWTLEDAAFGDTLSEQGPYFQSQTEAGFLLFVGDTARRLCWRAGFRVSTPNSASPLDLYWRIKFYGGAGRSWLSYQPISFVVTTPDITPMTVIATEDPSNGTHAATWDVDFDSTVSGGEPGYIYAWNFGDGGTSSSADPSHSYAFTGTFYPNLTVTDAVGQVAHVILPTITITGGSPPPPPPPPPPSPPPPPPGDLDPCGWDGQAATVVIPDGPFAGTYSATWSTLGGTRPVTLNFGPGGFLIVTWNNAGGVFYAFDGVLRIDETSHDCGTGVIVIPPFGGWFTTGSTTVTT